jgi:SprT-like family
MAKAITSRSKQPITTREYTGLQDAFDFFNAELFGSKLPDLVITLQRKAHSRGHFASDRFAERLGAKRQHHELNLNPDAMFGETDERVVSTLVHEQVHLAQFADGKAPSKGYHNKDWAARMKAVGLYPSSTGMPGGKETGQWVSHYVVPGGRFQIAFKKLAKSGWKLNLQSTAQPGATKSPPSKVKYACPECGLAVWGKPGIEDLAHAGECKALMQAAA